MSVSRMIGVAASAVVVACSVASAGPGLSDSEILAGVDTALRILPDRLATLNADMRRLGFYALNADRRSIPRALHRQIRSRIEGAFNGLESPALIFTPELRPLYVVSDSTGIRFHSGFRTAQEARDLAARYRLDGFLEADVAAGVDTVFVELRVIDPATLTAVWQESFESPVGRLSLSGVSLGMKGIGLTAAVPDPNVPPFAQYYVGEYRFMQKSHRDEHFKVFLAGGLMIAHAYIPSRTKTVVSGVSSVNFFGRVGIRAALVPVMYDGGPDYWHNWAALEISASRIFGEGNIPLSEFGARIECDVTQSITIGAGLSYVPPVELSYQRSAPGSQAAEVTVGGLSYELTLVRFWFTR